MRQNILITGASRGLGATLANQLASSKVRLFLWARDEKALSEVRKACEMKGAEVFTCAFDMSDIEEILKNFQEIDTQWPIDTIYNNAGLFNGAQSPGALEELSSEISIIDLNIKATIALGHKAASHMRLRQSGHIVFISSLAADFPLADAAGYSASKAGITAYATALREKLLDDGIIISDVRPGHIATAMTQGHSGALPMLLSPEKAAGIIIKGVNAKKAIIAFPKPLSWLIGLSRFLPWQLRVLAGKTQRFHIKR